VAARKIKGRWFADFRFQHADGRVERVRKRSPVQSKAGAEEFERRLRTELLLPSRKAREVPTFAEYADEFQKTYVLANNKPSEREAKACILKHHLLPAFGGMKLDSIRTHAIETLKASLLAKGLSRKRVNNVLACLGKMLRYANEIEALDVVPRIKLLKIAPQKFDFLTFEEFSRLLEAMKDDVERRALLLVAGEAGLRQGEVIALEWGDVDLAAGTLSVRRSSWRGHLGSPKSGRDRKIPLTKRLAAALQAARHLRSELVFCYPDGTPFSAVGHRGSAPVRLQAGRLAADWVACPPPHLLLSPRHARRSAEGGPGPSRAQHAHDAAQVHAPGTERSARGDRAAR
jgi:integrase